MTHKKQRFVGGFVGVGAGGKSALPAKVLQLVGNLYHYFLTVEVLYRITVV